MKKFGEWLSLKENQAIFQSDTPGISSIQKPKPAAPAASPSPQDNTGGMPDAISSPDSERARQKILEITTGLRQHIGQLRKISDQARKSPHGGYSRSFSASLDRGIESLTAAYDAISQAAVSVTHRGISPGF